MLEFRMFRNELFGGLKKGGRTGGVLSLQMVDELQDRCLFFGRKRIHGFNEALAGHPDESIRQARGGGFRIHDGLYPHGADNRIGLMNFVWLPSLDTFRTFAA